MNERKKDQLDGRFKILNDTPKKLTPLFPCVIKDMYMTNSCKDISSTLNAWQMAWKIVRLVLFSVGLGCDQSGADRHSSSLAGRLS